MSKQLGKSKSCIGVEEKIRQIADAEENSG